MLKVYAIFNFSIPNCVSWQRPQQVTLLISTSFLHFHMHLCNHILISHSWVGNMAICVLPNLFKGIPQDSIEGCSLFKSTGRDTIFQIHERKLLWFQLLLFVFTIPRLYMAWTLPPPFSIKDIIFELFFPSNYNWTFNCPLLVNHCSLDHKSEEYIDQIELVSLSFCEIQLSDPSV